MTPEEARKNLRDLELREFAYNHAAGMLYFDGVTAAPKGTYISRGKTLSVLNEAAYSLSNSEEARETLRVLSEHMDELTPAEQRIVELREKALRFRSRVPVDEYVAYQELLNEAATVWREAKATSDYAMFEPLLQRIIDACRRFAELVEPETDPYDFWLDNYEEGMTQEFCDKFFAELRAKLVPLIAKVGAAEPPDTSLLNVRFPLDKQAGALQAGAHALPGPRPGQERAGRQRRSTPYHSTFHATTRVTTKVTARTAFASSMFTSCVHEGGHALCRARHGGGIRIRTRLGRGAIHGRTTSRSRFFENITGPQLRLSAASASARSSCGSARSSAGMTRICFYRAVNAAQPGLVRIEADSRAHLQPAHHGALRAGARHAPRRAERQGAARALERALF
ncbi:MAG: hypothetical protein ACLTSG_12105 [Lachnospiraceae bacterium]